MVKAPTTFDEQVEFIERKGFVVDNKIALKLFLEKVNYYRFFAYLLPFRKSDKSCLEMFQKHHVDDSLSKWCFLHLYGIVDGAGCCLDVNNALYIER